ncbi:TetR/AcrR family transcriptional regulator [Flammeovirgaceae bacterium SG7u.111]|nr:TetR/AcrR family transcriptional regulator [Flammeovirgaceae bacterium SG7u.132]WPO36667.1 TetR/AcrR family transcriptional regulator [Flammeovirgaceae bacterium SG7u.111]
MGISERKERERQEMKELILHTAADIFVKSGFEKTSIRNIAEAIEYSPATIYLYFKDKNELFYAIQKEAFNKFFEYFQTVNREGSSVKMLRSLGEVYIKFAIENPGYYDLMFIMRAPMEAEDNMDDWDEGMRSHNVLFEIVDRCVEEGHFKGQDPFYVSHAIWSFVHGLSSLYVSDRMKMFPEENREKMMQEALHIFNDWMEKV